MYDTELVRAILGQILDATKTIQSRFQAIHNKQITVRRMFLSLRLFFLHQHKFILDLTVGEVYDPHQTTPSYTDRLWPEPRVCLTMKSMKKMKKAVAEFRSSFVYMLADVALQPFRLAHLSVWPKAKSLHVPSRSSW